MEGVLILRFIVALTLLPVFSKCQVMGSCNNQTINEFWHESLQTCGIDIGSVFQVYDKLQQSKSNTDQFGRLLTMEISKDLSKVLMREISNTIASGMLSQAPNLNIIQGDLYKTDKVLARAVWENALEELLERGIEIPHIMGQILSLKNDRLKFVIVDYYWRQYEKHFKHNSQFVPTITYAITNLLRENANLSTQQTIKADVILKQLPQHLLDIYQSWDLNVSVHNQQFNEFMLADQNKGPTPQKRLVFTFTPTPHSLKMKGKFKLHFSASGMVALAVHTSAGQRFLKSDEDSVYYCPDCDESSPTQWWYILWPHEHLQHGEEQYIYLQHSENGKLLCAASPYDNNRRWVQVMEAKDHMMIQSCKWQIAKLRRLPSSLKAQGNRN